MDLNKNAFRIVQSLTDDKQKDTPRTVAARAAGKSGGRARAELLTAAERHNIAVKANRARWRKAV